MWLFFSLSAAIIFALANILDKIMLERYSRSASTSVIVLGLFSLLIFLLAQGVGFFTEFDIQENFSYIWIFAGIFEAAYIYFYLRALELESVLLSVPFFFVSPILIFLVSAIFFQEVPTYTQVMGMFIIGIGLWLLHSSKGNSNKGALNKATILMLLSAIFYAAHGVLADKALETASVLNLVVYSRLGVLIGAVVIALIVGKKSWLPLKSARPLLFALVEIVYALAFVCLINALRLGHPALVFTIEATQLLFVLLFSALIHLLYRKLLPDAFNFNQPKLTVISILAVVAGIWLIY